MHYGTSKCCSYQISLKTFATKHLVINNLNTGTGGLSHVSSKPQNSCSHIIYSVAYKFSLWVLVMMLSIRIRTKSFSENFYPLLLYIKRTSPKYANDSR